MTHLVGDPGGLSSRTLAGYETKETKSQNLLPSLLHGSQKKKSNVGKARIIDWDFQVEIKLTRIKPRHI